MDNLKLNIGLLPRGAWGNNLRECLSKDEWDKLRNYCYSKANNKCEICGKADIELEAHEEWQFDEQNTTQTLTDIIALCPACHGVKHMRNSIRIGYGEQSKAHFIKINKCDQMTFAKYYAEATFKFEELSKILRWRIVADLDKFGGKGIEIKQREIPLITNPYDDVDFLTGTSSDLFKITKTNINPNILEPKVRKITVNNYDGTIIVVADYANKIVWFGDSKTINSKYNIVGKFTTKFSVENLGCKELYFKLSGKGGETISQAFLLDKAI